MINAERFQSEVGAWAEQTFPQSTNKSIITHLHREVAELESCEIFGAPMSFWQDEAADCLLLLLHLAHRQGFDLLAAGVAKFRVNQRREWGAIDAEGVVERVREGGA